MHDKPSILSAINDGDASEEDMPVANQAAHTYVAVVSQPDRPTRNGPTSVRSCDGKLSLVG